MNVTLKYHWLNSFKGLTPEAKQFLVGRYGIDDLYALNRKGFEEVIKDNDLRLDPGIPDPTEEGFKNCCVKSFEDALNSKAAIICPEDPGYPEALKEIYTPPLCLYYLGNLPTGKSLAVVGARNCSDYGFRMAGYFGGGLAKAGIEVISGMARGIDGAAQRAALNEGGKSFAVLGSGVDVIYPGENRDIYERMIQKGGVISEFPPGEPPNAANFPRRNRIISALAEGILLIEASYRSGSLITVNYGLEQGKEIMAVPGRIDEKFSEGCLDIIKSGATPVTSVKDVLFTMGFADCTKAQ
jgi:DNA processing protein